MDASLIVCWIAAAIICFAIAKEKGKNVYVAVALGLLFGFFAVLGYALARGSKEYQIKKAKER